MLNHTVACGFCCLILMLFATTAVAADNVVVVTSRNAQGANDVVPWSQLGSDATLLGTSFNAVSLSGVTVAGTLAGANSLVSVVCPAVQCSWSGANFSSGDSVIWTSDTGNSGNGPVTLVFGTSITGVGALIQANAPGQFTAQIQAFNGATVLGTFPVTSDPAGDAVYIGVQDQTAPNITKVVFSLTACAPVDSSGCTDFAIDALNLNSGPAVASFSPRSLSFGVVPLGATTSQSTTSLVNTGGAFLQTGSIAVAGGNSGDFILSQSCPASLGPGTSCLLKISFKPTGAGPRKSSISVSGAGNSSAIILTGVGSAGGPSATSLTFASQTVGTSSAPQVVTFANNGSGTMNMWQIAIVGANAGDFSMTTTCGSTLGAGANCTVSVTFKPTATGARTALLLFSDDGGGSPQAVSLSGTGS